MCFKSALMRASFFQHGIHLFLQVLTQAFHREGFEWATGSPFVRAAKAFRPC
jgi:hypothetical protein